MKTISTLIEFLCIRTSEILMFCWTMGDIFSKKVLGIFSCRMSSAKRINYNVPAQTDSLISNYFRLFFVFSLSLFLACSLNSVNCTQFEPLKRVLTMEV